LVNVRLISYNKYLTSYPNQIQILSLLYTMVNYSIGSNQVFGGL